MDVILDPIPYHFLLCFIYFFWGGEVELNYFFGWLAGWVGGWVVGWRELN